MKRKPLVLVLAIAGMLGMPMAALAEVDIFGYIDVSFDNVEAKGATVPGTNVVNRNHVTSNLSMIGFKGKEDLGGGLKVVWMVVSLIPFDEHGTINAVNTGLIADRDSWVGLAGDWGTVRAGRGNSPYKLSTIGLDPFGDIWYGGVAAYDNIIGAAFTSGTGFPWDVVTGNMVEYVSPDFSGFSGGFMYSANEGRTTTPNVNPSVYSVAGKYSQGPLYLTLAYEQHNDALLGPTVGLAAGGTSSTDKAYRVGGQYTFGNTFGNTTPSVMYERQQYEQDGTLITERNVNLYMLALKHVTGPHIFRASWLKAQDVSGLPNTGAQQFALGYGYTLSKSTELFGAWARLINDSAATYTPLTFLINGLGLPTGADPNMFTVGIHHNF